MLLMRGLSWRGNARLTAARPLSCRTLSRGSCAQQQRMLELEDADTCLRQRRLRWQLVRYCLPRLAHGSCVRRRRTLMACSRGTACRVSGCRHHPPADPIAFKAIARLLRAAMGSAGEACAAAEGTTGEARAADTVRYAS